MIVHANVRHVRGHVCASVPFSAEFEQRFISVASTKQRMRSRIEIPASIRSSHANYFCTVKTGVPRPGIPARSARRLFFPAMLKAF